MKCPTRQQIESTVKAKGYKWFENGDYNLNIVGVRNGETLNEVTNKFDDCITLSYRKDGEWQFHCILVLVFVDVMLHIYLGVILFYGNLYIGFLYH